MAYTRVNWQDLPSTATPRNATNLNKMDKGIKDLDDGKQDLLVSGSNIKTINNQSVLGSGNIDVNLHYYSTEETLYGYDTDGEPVYEKTINGTTPNTYITTLLTGVDRLFYAEGYIQQTGGNKVLVNSTYADNSSNAVRVYYDKNGLVNMQYGTNSSIWYGVPYKVTIRYTKLSSASLLSIQSEGE